MTPAPVIAATRHLAAGNKSRGLGGAGFGEAGIAEPDDVEYRFVVVHQIVVSLDPRVTINDRQHKPFLLRQNKDKWRST